MVDEIERLTRAIDLDPKNAEAYFNRGIAYANKGELNNAIADYDKAIELNPENLNAYLVRGSVHANRRELNKAIADYDKAIELDSENSTAFFVRGSAYAGKGEFDNAMADYDKAITLDSASPDAYLGRGTVYLQKDEWDNAIADYDKVIELNPKSSATYVNRGTAYVKKGELDNAIIDYNKVIELSPESPDGYFNLGSVYVKKERWDMAITNINKAIELAPKDPTAYFHRGTTYAKKGELDNAITDYGKAIELNPQYFDAYFNRGFTYSRKDELDNAITDYDKAIELNPQHFAIYLNRGAVYAQKENWGNAIADFDKAVELNPQYLWTYLNRGRAYFKKGEWDNAIANYTKAIEFMPQNFDAYFNRGFSYTKKREWGKAIADYDKVIELDSENSTAYLNRGRVYLIKENYEQSFEDFVRADELEPTLKFTYIHIYVASRINNATRRSPDERSKVIENYLKLSWQIEGIQRALFYEPRVSEVAHYTSLDTLKDLVGKKRFRLYNSTYMNDSEEGRIFFDVMKKLPEESRIDSEAMFYKRSEDNPYRSPAYIGSFVKLDSEQKDKLFLWRTYGKHNGEDAAGGCLIFPRASFAENHLPQVGSMRQHISTSIDLEGEQSSALEEKPNSKPPIYEITYIDKDGDKEILKDTDTKSPKISLVLLPELAKCLKEIDNFIKTNKKPDDIKQNDTKDKLKQLTRELLDGIRFLFKSSDYREEQEVRVIQFHYHDESQEKESDDIKADMEQVPPRFYLEAPEDFRCNEVILGPMAQNLHDWQWWIEKQDENVKVSRSEINFGKLDS